MNKYFIIKNLLSCFLMLFNSIFLKAQKTEYQPEMFKLKIKELKTPTEPIQWSFGNAYLCKGNLVTILSCLLKRDKGRLIVKGEIPEKFLDLELIQPSNSNIAEMLATKNEGKINDLEELTLVNTTIALLGKKYNFSLKNVIDSIDVWCLRTVDTSKFKRFVETGNFEDKYAGSDSASNSYEIMGQELSFLCYVVSLQSATIIYDESNEKGLLNFASPRIPINDMKNFQKINSFLEKYYGLHL
jgi:hypothetical protein